MSRRLNIELAEKVLQQVEQHPETHDQNHWMRRNSCGTTACLAGWTVSIAASDHEPDWEEDLVETGAEYAEEVIVPGRDVYRAISVLAAELLGMDFDDAFRMFHVMDARAAIGILRGHVEEARAAASA